MICFRKFSIPCSLLILLFISFPHITYGFLEENGEQPGNSLKRKGGWLFQNKSGKRSCGEITPKEVDLLTLQLLKWDSQEEFSQALCLVGLRRLKEGRSDVAISHFEYLLSLTETDGFVVKGEKRARTYFAAANAYLERGEFAKAIVYCSQAIKLKDIKGQVVLNESEVNEVLEVLRCCFSSRAGFEAVKDEVKSIVEHGQQHFRNENFAEAIQCFDQALKKRYADKFLVLTGISRLEALHVLGLAYLEESSFDRAIYYLQQALELRDDQGDCLLVGDAFAENVHALGVCFVKNGELDRGISYFRKALDQKDENEAPFWKSVNRASLLHELGITYFNKKEFENAAVAFRAALSQKDEDDRFDWEGKNRANTLINLAFTHSQLRDPWNAIIYLKEALALKERHYVLTGYFRMSVLRDLGNFYEKIDDISNAVKYWKASLRLRGNGGAYALGGQERYDLEQRVEQHEKKATPLSAENK